MLTGYDDWKVSVEGQKMCYRKGKKFGLVNFACYSERSTVTTGIPSILLFRGSYRVTLDPLCIVSYACGEILATIRKITENNLPTAAAERLKLIAR